MYFVKLGDHLINATTVGYIVYDSTSEKPQSKIVIRFTDGHVLNLLLTEGFDVEAGLKQLEADLLNPKVWGRYESLREKETI